MTDTCPCQAGYRPSTAYRRGCRHPHVRRHQNRHEKHRIHGLTPPPYVDGTGTARRLQALAAIGWSSAALAEHTGLAATHIAQLRFRRRARVRRDTAALITQLYDQLWDQPGPSRHMRERAHLHDWAPPLAWDDHTIDDPAAVPDHGRRPRGRIDDADVTHLSGYGLTRDEIADRLGVTPDSLRDTLTRRRKAS